MEKIPGVVQEEEGYGLHSFRRWRETYLRLEAVPQPIRDFWIGHGKKSISDVYTKVKLEATKRKNWCEQAGLGFAFTRSEEKVVEITKSQGSEAAA